MNKQKNIVIVGGGFGGVTALTELAKHVKYGNLKETKITLVDRKDYHLYYPNLYEVASAEEEFTSIGELKKSIAFPFEQILPKGSSFVKASLVSVNRKENSIKLKDDNGVETILPYDYLVLALGSVSDDFGIPGIKEHALPLNGLNDALRIKNALSFLVQSNRMDTQKKSLRVILGGGGFTGVELVSEILNLVEIMSWKYNYPAEKIELMIIEGSNQLVNGMPSYISSIIYHRLKSFGVNIVLNKMITKVEKDMLTLNNGEVIHHDLFIWTGGIKSAEVPFNDEVKKDRKGRVGTMPDLSVNGSPNIYMVGDDACVMDDDEKPMPPTATQAIMHAEYVAKVITARISGKDVPNYSCRPSPFIIPLKGKWAILHLPSGFTMQGYIPWLLKAAASFRYFKRFMSFSEAFRAVALGENLYTRND